MGRVLFGAVMGCLSTAGACVVFGVPGDPLPLAAEREIRDTRRSVEALSREVAGLRSRLEHRPHSVEEDAARRAALGSPVARPEPAPAMLPRELVEPHNVPVYLP